MAKMIEEVIVIKLSKLVKDNDLNDTIADGEIQAAAVAKPAATPAPAAQAPA